MKTRFDGMDGGTRFGFHVRAFHSWSAETTGGHRKSRQSGSEAQALSLKFIALSICTTLATYDSYITNDTFIS
jgi:hypothetical protein